jgi:calcineurin-like phosphoesterase family protein
MGKRGNGYHEIWQKGIEGQMVVACHYNLRVWPASHYNSWLVYGHSHGKLAPEGKQWDVGVDNNNFYPVSFDTLKVIMDNSPDNFNLVKKNESANSF